MYKQNLRENYSKSNKIAITACKFSNIFRGSLLPDLPRAFLAFCDQLPISSAEKKFRLKKCRNYASFFEFLATPLSSAHQHFPYEKSKFRSKVAAKDSQGCDSIIRLHFCLLFANYL